ncbi:hypothetical protein, partial [Salmonella enterica]|uniref:hypothetical protein n=1 Tax=Salmonella enterica TaxID=28901 RepID=UPI0032B5F951
KVSGREESEQNPLHGMSVANEQAASVQEFPTECENSDGMSVLSLFNLHPYLFQSYFFSILFNPILLTLPLLQSLPPQSFCRTGSL